MPEAVDELHAALIDTAEILDKFALVQSLEPHITVWKRRAAAVREAAAKLNDLA